MRKKEGVEKMCFNFIKLKQEFFWKVYGHLLECDWPHMVIVYEGDTDYYTIILVAFHDEKRYFRKMEMPLPVMQAEAEKGNELAKLLLKNISDGADNVKREPRTLWGKVPVRDLYGMLSGDSSLQG